VDEPMMVMTGSLDESTRTAQTPLSRCQPYYYAPAGGKYLVYIQGATHMSFTGKLGGDAGPDERLSGPMNRALGLTAEQERRAESYDQAAIFSWVRTASLAFWDAHLKGSETARQWLESGALNALSAGQAGVWHK
jgi:predicted dienelactone hydrolase